MIAKFALRLFLILSLLSIPIHAAAQTVVPGTPHPTNTPAAATTARPTATATSRPALAAAEAGKMLDNGRWLQLIGDCDRARREFAALIGAGGAAAITAEAQLRLAQCYLRDEAYVEAMETLRDLLRTAPAKDPQRTPGQFLLGESLLALASWKDAEAAYAAYIKLAPELEYLAWQRIGAARRGAGDAVGAVAAYQAALGKSPDWTNTLSIRRTLANIALDQGRNQEAVAQYDALRGATTTGAFASEMQYLAGNALAQNLLASAVATVMAAPLTATGTPAASAGTPAVPLAPPEALKRWQAAVDADVTSKYAHAAIVALLDAGATVDEYQRGVANYHQKQYALAVAAFDRLRTTEPSGRQGLAWYYSGLSHLGLGETDKGISELDHFIKSYPNSPQ